MKDSEIREKLSKGWIRAIITFEVAGKPKEHIEKSLTGYLDNIKKDDRIEIIQEEREEAMEHEDGIFSTFAECEMLIENLETVTWLSINFSPASIEVLEPDDLVMPARDLTNWFNDLLAKIHDIGTDYRSQKASNTHLVLAMNQLIRNTIMLSLRLGKKTEKELSKETGIVGDQLKDFLKDMTEKKTIIKEKNSYRVP